MDLCQRRVDPRCQTLHATSLDSRSTRRTGTQFTIVVDKKKQKVKYTSACSHDNSKASPTTSTSAATTLYDSSRLTIPTMPGHVVISSGHRSSSSRVMLDTIRCRPSHPLNEWMGSMLQCKECGNVSTLDEVGASATD